MLEKIIAPVASLAAIAAGGAALWFYAQDAAKAERIEDLEVRVLEQSGAIAAFDVLAQQRPRIEINYRDQLATVNAAGEETSNACLTDPRVRAAYAALGLRGPASDPAP